MDCQYREFINELTKAIIQHYNISIPIIDMISVVGEIGGRIFKDCNSITLKDNRIEKVGDSFVITISPFQPDNRINFTIAHELGHLFLHMGYAIDNELWNSQDTDPYYHNINVEMEYQANEFARALLMPKNKYKEIIDKYSVGDVVDTAKVAEYFHVSVGAASNRGKWLGYLKE